ncbi:unnamed protein product [Peronospora destructor]|uniref:Uncharacterized protein n=3 Tax=Peronospora destructor TaxID=86335 RepID=A0AAV0U1J7_9STRA|nr:unnamed protein product [Peronospora destructor]
MTLSPHHPLDVWALDHVLYRSFGHPLSIQLLALSSLVLLLSFSLFSLAPWLANESGQALQLGSDSFAVDHLVVFVAIVLSAIWLLLVNIAYSKLTFALLLLRVASCLTVSFALTVFLAEFLSRRAMLALLALIYASLGLVYSWSVPIWRWYQEEARTKGLVSFLPQSAQKLLLQTSLLQWLIDISFADKVALFLPFLLPLTRMEQMRLMEQMPPESQVMMTKPGLLPLLPGLVQNLLLPAQDSDNDSEKKGEEADASEGRLAGQVETERVSWMEQKKVLTSACLSTTGFDFHRPDVVKTVRTPPSREQVFNEIVASRMWNGCKELVKVPAAKVLNRAAAMSSALLVMQLYASRRSRKILITSVHFIAASALSSVACCAIFLRFVQLLDLTWTSRRAVPLLCYARQYLLRNAGSPQISDQPVHGVSVTLRSTASSVSLLVAALYILRKLRR